MPLTAISIGRAQLTGTLGARALTTRAYKSKAEDDIAWADQPKWTSLRTRLASKEQRIDKNTIRSNAEMLLRLFEQDIVKHVARTQADTKTMKALLCRDKEEE